MSKIALITGSCGLVGSECARFFAARGMDILGVDNNMRGEIFGEAGCTAGMAHKLTDELGFRYSHCNADISTASGFIAPLKHRIDLIVHCAATPSHDWSGRNPLGDFEVNALGTIKLLEAARIRCPDAKFIFVSSSKVYGDRINGYPFGELPTRYETQHANRRWYVNERDLGIDLSMHSPYGASKAAADLMVQEYGKYYGMRTVCFRPNCITGPNHAGVELHGFLNYLVKCAATGKPYRVFGYGGKQVRDNIHAKDLVRAFALWYDNPSAPGEVYNLGGGHHANCSILEAIEIAEQVTGNKMDYTIEPEARKGDHIWWITDNGKFQQRYPDWKPTYTIEQLIQEIYDHNKERWATHAVLP